jgi:hypothetical protein
MKLNHLFHTVRASTTALLAAISLAGITTANAANFFDNTISGINLGNASGGTTGGHRTWAIFSLSGNVSISNSSLDSQYEVLGNIGIAGTTGKLNLTLAEVKGTVYLGKSGNYNNGGTITGGAPIVDATYLSTAVTNANTATSTAAGLATATGGLSRSGGVNANVLTSTSASPVSLSLNNAVGGITDNGVAGTYVLNLASLALTGANAILTLTGTASTNYVINLSQALSLTTNSQIVLSGGLQPQNVLFNVKTTATTDVTISGGSSLKGIILATNRLVNLTGASKVEGEVIAKAVTLSGSSQVKNPFVSP